MSHFQTIALSVIFGLCMFGAELLFYRRISRRGAQREWAAYHRWMRGQRENT